MHCRLWHVASHGTIGSLSTVRGSRQRKLPFCSATRSNSCIYTHKAQHNCNVIHMTRRCCHRRGTPGHSPFLFGSNRTVSRWGIRLKHLLNLQEQFNGRISHFEIHAVAWETAKCFTTILLNKKPTLNVTEWTLVFTHPSHLPPPSRYWTSLPLETLSHSRLL